MATVYLGPWGIALAGAASWRQRVQGLAPAALVFAVPLLLICGMTVVLLLFEELFGADPIVRLAFSAAALVLLPLAVVRNVLNMARSRESAETIERRQLLAAARRWLAGELGKPEPRLEDAWYPYLLALGLGTDVSRWFRAFGGASGGGMTAGSSAGWSGGGGGGTLLRRLERRRRGLRRRRRQLGLGGGGGRHLRRRGFAELERRGRRRRRRRRRQLRRRRGRRVVKTPGT